MTLKVHSDIPKNAQKDLQPRPNKIVLSPSDIEAKKASFKEFQASKTWLEESFSKAFNFKEPKPLKIGIQHDLLLVPSPYSKAKLRKCLGVYVSSKAYLEATVQENWRYDLHGERVEEVTQEQKDYALKRLEYKKALWEKNKKYQKKHN